jgi:pSer/pThr/pTyr-binding forkhead associated (FHA) protein
MPRVTITVPEKNAQPYRFQLDRQSVTLGRGSENDIAIDCGSISLKHAEMRRVEGGYTLRDLGSTNGIKLDGERSEEIALRSGISLKLGDVAFDFLLTDEEREALSREKPYTESPVLREPEKTPAELPPLKEIPPRPQRSLPMLKDKGIGGYGMLLLFVLAVVVFGAGMAVRFRKETGGSMIDAIRAKRQVTKAPITTVPDATAPDATVPDATVPDATAPDTTAPDTTAPDATAPDATAPDATVPDATAPDTTVPDATVPDATPMTPDADAPQQ